MALTVNKSAIRQVRDQLSLDFAEGEYLDRVGQNLGINSSIFSFDDSIWRALVKTIALDYKQVASKFSDVLSILFGPKTTITASLAEDAAAGDVVCVLNNTSNIPQTGTLVFDEGLATEETVSYKLIDRHTKEVFLNAELSFAHSSYEQDIEEVLTVIGTSGTLICPDVSAFSDLATPFNVLVDKGLPTEAVYSVSSVSSTALSVSPSPVGVHEGDIPTNILTTVAQDYADNSTILVVDDSSAFPESGTLLVHNSEMFNINATSAGLGSLIISVPANTFIANAVVGYELVFTGSVTAVLAGVKRRIVANGTASVTVDEDFTEVGDFPHIGDDFYLRAIVDYSSNDTDNNYITLRNNIANALSVEVGDKVELLEGKRTVSLAAVQCKGVGWDVIQSTPRVVELYIPEEIRDINDLRSASYLHDDTVDPSSLPITVFQTNATAGSTNLNIAAAPDFPVTGVVILDEGNPEEEIVSYFSPISYLREDTAVGTTSLKLRDTTGFPTGGTILVDYGGSWQESLVYTANDTDTATITLFGQTSYFHYQGTSVRCVSSMNIATPLENTHTTPAFIELYHPVHAGTDLPLGDFNQDENTYPGPYVYDYTERAPAGTIAVTNPTNIVPGPEYLVMEQVAGNSALEVKSALAMLEGLDLPFTVSVGRDSLLVSAISLKSRVETTLSNAESIGDYELELASFSGPDGTGFPSGSGYRIVIDEGGANQEVAYVVSASEGDSKVRVSPVLSKNHLAGETVRLMSDVLTTNTIILDHNGLVPFSQRSYALVGDKSYLNTPAYRTYTTIVTPKVDCFTVDSVGSLDTEGGIVMFNFGDGVLSSRSTLSVLANAGDTTVTLADATDFPSSTPYIVTIGENTRFEEHLVVTLKSGNVLTLGGGTYGVLYSHPIGTQISFIPGQKEDVEYNSIDTSDLCFDPTVMLKYTHYPVETLFASEVVSDPSDDGFDFPLRMPVDLAARLEYIIDLIRAAGVQVKIIDER